MLKNSLALILAIFILSACAAGPSEYFKLSANNKLFDRTGFHGEKRLPLYNPKYIEKAKRNVATSSFDDNDGDSDYLENEHNPSNSENVSLANREMYRRMLEEDAERKTGIKQARRNIVREELEYPSISKANSGFYDERDEISELRKELDEVKSMLSAAKRDLANNKYPTSGKTQEEKQTNHTNISKQKSYKVNSADKKIEKRMENNDMNKNVIETPLTNNEFNMDRTIIEPIKSNSTVKKINSRDQKKAVAPIKSI